MTEETKSFVQVVRETCAPLNNIDPFYWIVWLTHLPFDSTELKEEEREFVTDNMSKNRWSWWVTCVAVFCVLMDPPADTDQLKVTAFALTTAWYIISFAAIPVRFIHVSMHITFTMFTGFWAAQCSLAAMALVDASIYQWVLYLLVLGCVYIASVLYDTADGLKAGLDEAQLKSSRAQILWHQREHGINIDEE